MNALLTYTLFICALLMPSHLPMLLKCKLLTSPHLCMLCLHTPHINHLLTYTSLTSSPYIIPFISYCYLLMLSYPLLTVLLICASLTSSHLHASHLHPPCSHTPCLHHLFAIRSAYIILLTSTLPICTLLTSSHLHHPVHIISSISYCLYNLLTCIPLTPPHLHTL